MPELNIGDDWGFEDRGPVFVLRHNPTGNEWKFSNNGDFDLPADLTGRVNQTIYDGTEEIMSASLDPDVKEELGSNFYLSRRV
jgi:hypothetical protein